MQHTHSNPIQDEEETVATPRFAEAADAPKKVVPLGRIRAHTASAVRRVRHRVRPASSDSTRLNWLPLVLLFLLAGVAGGYFLASGNERESIEDAPVVRSELEAEPDNLNADAKKSAFVEKSVQDNNNQPANSAETGEFLTGEENSETVPARETEAEPETAGNNILTVEEKPEVATEITVRNGEKSAKQSSEPRNEEDRLELIRKDAERQAAREREERNRRRSEQKTEADQEEKPKNNNEQNKKQPDQQTEQNDSDKANNSLNSSDNNQLQ